MKSLLLCFALFALLQACFGEVNIPPFGASSGSPSSSSGSTTFDPNAIRVVSCVNIGSYFAFTSAEVGNNAVSTLTFQLHTGTNAGFTGAYAAVNSNSQSAAVFVIVSTFDKLEEIDPSSKVVATQTLDFSADAGSATNCSAASQSVYELSITSKAGASGSLTLSCRVVAKETTIGGITISPNRMKCDVTIRDYVYANIANKLRLTGQVGYNSVSVSSGTALGSACSYANGHNLCIRGSSGVDAFVSFANSVSTGATFSGSANVETVLLSAPASGFGSAYAGVNTGNQMQWIFHAAGESNLFWDPEVGVAPTAFAAHLSPSFLVGALLLLVALIATLL